MREFAKSRYEGRVEEGASKSPDACGSGLLVLLVARGLSYFTVSVNGVALETPPPEPFTVMVNVPVVAERLTLIVMVELPVPPEMDEGLKLILAPLF